MAEVTAPVVLDAPTKGEGEGYDVCERVMQLFSDAQTAFKAEGERREVYTYMYMYIT